MYSPTNRTSIRPIRESGIIIAKSETVKGRMKVGAGGVDPSLTETDETFAGELAWVEPRPLYDKTITSDILHYLTACGHSPSSA